MKRSCSIFCYYDDYINVTTGTVMNNIQISKSEFKAKALEYFRQVESSGTSLIVTDHGNHPLRYVPTMELSALPYRYSEPVGEDDWEALS